MRQEGMGINQNSSSTTATAVQNLTEKVNLRCFKLHHSHSNSFNLSNDFFQVLNSKGLYLSSQKEKGNGLLPYVHIHHKM